MNYQQQLSILISNALAEDTGDGDHSTLATIDADKTGKATLKIKESGILAGMSVAETIFKHVEPSIKFTAFKKDGDEIFAGDIAFEVEGRIHTILLCERLALNCMQRMTGIASLTRKYVEKLKGFHTRLLDTRKTTPNFRLLEKEAVRIGGALNHRMGLFDMIMLKDNHIDFSGGITPAIARANSYISSKHPGLEIEVETRSIEDVKEVLAVGKINRIMLDNFSPEMISEALILIDGRFETEASGGINYENLANFAATGVDYISSGAIIHQAVSLNLSLKSSNN